MLERFLSGPLAAILVFLPVGDQCWSKDGLPYRPISEEAVRTASAQLYSNILKIACVHGRRYPRSQIESGFKRHFAETKLTFVQEGYIIVPNTTKNNSFWSLSEMEFDAKRRLDLRPQFGCFGAYWLDDNRDW